MSARIGPYLLDDPNIEPANDKQDYPETFTMMVSHQLANELEAFGGDVKETKVGHISLLQSTGMWGLIPVDASIVRQDNVNLTHRGYGLLSSKTETKYYNPDLAKIEFEFYKICNFDDYLYMNFTTGNSDGTLIDDGYNLDPTGMSNVVALPITTIITTTPDFYRNSKYGPIPCYLNPTYHYDLSFKIGPADFFKGSVQAFDNTDPENEILITNPRFVIDKTKFYIENGIIKLETTNNSVKFSYWDGAQYTLLNEFVIGTINVIKLKFINTERIELQINTSTWTIWRGKPFFKVENHPNLSYTHKGTYDHDSISTTYTGTGQNITMQSKCYTLAYNSGDIYQLLVVRQNKEDIKVDQIIASDRTVIGFINRTITGTNPDGYQFNAYESFKEVDQSIGFKQM